LVVAAGLIALRIREPNRPRPFRCPGYPLVPLLAMASCLGLMLGLPAMNWLRFGVWLLVGFVLYWLYGRRKSRLAMTAPVSE